MARALAASGVSIFARASMYSSRAGAAESSRRPRGQRLDRHGIVDGADVLAGLLVAVAAQPAAPALQLLEPLLLGGFLLPLALEQFDFLGQLPLALVLHVAALGHDLVAA